MFGDELGIVEWVDPDASWGVGTGIYPEGVAGSGGASVDPDG